MLHLDRPGRTTFELLFRVGSADEALPTRGTTHLLEHLALEDRLHDDRLGGWTSRLITGFWTEASPEDAGTLLAELICAIVDPPAANLDRERLVLEREAELDGAWAGDWLLRMRYGAAGAGLEGYTDFGLRSATPSALREWAAINCTGANAVGWCMGPLPVDALHLPEGEARPAPQAVPVDGLSLPAEEQVEWDGVAVGLVADDGVEFGLGLEAAAAHALQALRNERGLVYDVETSWAPIDRRQNHGVLEASSPPGAGAVVRDGLLDALDAVAAGRAGEFVETARSARLRRLGDPDRLPDVVRAAARLELLGRSDALPASRLAAIEAVDPDGVAAAVGAAIENVVAVVPEGTRRGRLPLFRLPEHTGAQGPTYPARHLSRHTLLDSKRLTIGEDRASLEEDDETTTVRYADVAAAIRTPGGGLDLIARDGALLEVAPDDHRRGPEALAAIEAKLPGQLVVPLSDREQRVEHAAEVAGLTGWMTADTPDAVMAALAPDEQVLAISEASQGARSGVLVLSSRRLLLATKFLETRTSSWELSEIEDLRVRAGPAGGRVTFRAPEGPQRIWLAWPRTARAFAAALRRATDT